MLNAVHNNVLVIYKDNITVLSHNLHHQAALYHIPQFIEIFQADADHSFQSRLFHRQDPGAIQMLSEEHAEIGSRQWGWFWIFRQV